MRQAVSIAGGGWGACIAVWQQQRPQPHLLLLAHACPQAPQLMTSMRARPARFKSQAELEAEAAEQAQREAFHARPLE